MGCSMSTAFTTIPSFCVEYKRVCNKDYVDCANAFPKLAPGDDSFTGNTQACRERHLSSAKMSPRNAILHCAHASASGGGVCVDETTGV